ncbi:RNA pyrophosphohydrolase [Rickettsiales bacterium]|nr:RNA pyrophosphohydrolase [Rickettsiales bacterium]MDB2550360.1 RNA pyrophosphohydrolase [Rickettsiales bacterium]
MDQNIDHLYRPCVGIIVVNQKKELFLAKRISSLMDAYWQFPQGGIDAGESEENAMYRELEEETGINKEYVKILNISKDYFYYNVPIELIERVWKGRYIGQKQRWYMVQFFGNDNIINLEQYKPEFSEWKWQKNISQIPDLVIDFKKELYQDLVQEFTQYLK